MDGRVDDLLAIQLSGPRCVRQAVHPALALVLVNAVENKSHHYLGGGELRFRRLARGQVAGVLQAARAPFRLEFVFTGFSHGAGPLLKAERRIDAWWY